MGVRTIIELVEDQRKRVLETYRIDNGLVQEHANGERRIQQGGYGERQIFELVQNGADELRRDPGGTIEVVLTDSHLYCANQGDPMTVEGADTILRMGVSRKRGGQIGRFGVGVKSVLSVSDSPQFFGRGDGDCFGFERSWAEGLIRSVVPYAAEVPVLRIARPLDRAAEITADPVLAELCDRATTVVRLPLVAGHASRLGEDIARFPAQFPLFSPHVGAVVFDDRRDGHVVRWRLVQREEGGRRIITTIRGDSPVSEETWRVFTRTHTPTGAALRDAGELHDRPTIDIAWAVPEENGRSNKPGRFWAYFPTNFTTSLKGIVNAPWKTSEDRQNLYKGNRFNEELIKVTAELVLNSLPLLATEEDPCAHLDAVPARGREEPQFAASELVNSVWRESSNKPTLPDQNGTFQPASRVKLHPEKMRKEWLSLWACHSGRPDDWCDHSAEKSPHRRHSAERLVRECGSEVASVSGWLTALVADGSPEASARAVLILAEMKRWEPALVGDATGAKIVLTESGGLVAPGPRVFRRADDDALGGEMAYVDPRVLDVDLEDGRSSEDVRRALEFLGVYEADAAGRFAAALKRGTAGYGKAQWDAFWELSRQAGPGVTLALFHEHGVDPRDRVAVRNLLGEYRPVRDCLRPGPVVPGDASRDAEIAVDMGFHAADAAVLRAEEFGLLDRPVARHDPEGKAWYLEYKEAVWKSYCSTLPASSSRPQAATMRIEGAPPAGPLGFLPRLSPEGCAAFFAAMPSGGYVGEWTVQAGRQTQSRRPVKSPLVWMAKRHGHLTTSRGIRRVGDCAGTALKDHADVLPVAQAPEALCSIIGLPRRLGDVTPAIWRRIAQEAAESTDDAFPGRVYALFFEAEAEWPEDAPTRCRVGEDWHSDIADTEIAATADPQKYRELVSARVPALLAPDERTAEKLYALWYLRRPEQAIRKELRHTPTREPVPVSEEYPLLGRRTRDVEGWRIVHCSELEEVVRTENGMNTATLNSASGDFTVFVRAPKDGLAALMAVDREIGLGMGRAKCEDILRQQEQTEERERRNDRLVRAKSASALEEKLLALLDVDQIISGLPKGLVGPEQREDADRVARAAVHTHRTNVLGAYKTQIGNNLGIGIGRFHGDAKSVEFVNDLRLPEDYAGYMVESLEAREIVDGPSEFPRLHDYQEKIAAALYDMLTLYRGGRAMLCLPTGAGKTRVAAEAVIRWVKKEGTGGRPILWIAQSSELCEQAVQSWKFVWRTVGADRPLTINRLWEDREAAATTDGPQLVVATDAKLERCLDKDEYAWLRDAAVVLVDEAHTSIGPRYSGILRSLGLDRRQPARPLVGLTATPFRGFNDEETRRLVARYGGKRLDEGALGKDPVLELQDLGVLARIEHREITGATIALSASEQEEAFDRNWLPKAAEFRLASDEVRTDAIIDAVRGLPNDGPVLLFATSVLHAHVIAGRLNELGIDAASVDANTPRNERRKLVSDFGKGRLRVLTNYGVLHQGFDAPATRTVVIARPTYSPNTYQQMIGRGLRGPLNRGKPICRILDVHDNITNYGAKPAFTDFEYLWERP